jgi:SPP1 family predicted phage head-tail adaptor
MGVSTDALNELSPGRMNQRVAFDKRAPADDGAGNKEGNWVEQFQRAARIVPKLGGEEVTARRLQGTSVVVIQVRSDSKTQQITPQWRARDVRNNIAYNIRSIQNPDERNIALEFMCESGGPG